MIVPKRITHRIYYWLEGTPYARPGGPWWWRDFDHLLEANAMVEAIRSECKSMYYVNNEKEPLPEHTADSIEPPARAINILEEFDVFQLASASGRAASLGSSQLW